MCYFVNEEKPTVKDTIKFIVFCFAIIFFLLLCLEEGLKRQDERLKNSVHYEQSVLGEYSNDY